MQFKLYSYYRSSCSWRIRIALNIKQISYEIIPVNILKNEQQSEEYLKKNPSGLVPTLSFIDDSGKEEMQLGQSIAILEFLEDSFPNINGTMLLPPGPYDRAQIRQAVNIIAADTQPLQNLRNLQNLFGSEKEKEKTAYAAGVIERGLGAFQKTIRPGKYCFGDQLTIADCVLIPQLFNARRFGLDTAKLFPTLTKIEENLSKLDAFIKAAPENQPDFPKN
jgi:maleylacetoacetate isomerase